MAVELPPYPVGDGHRAALQLGNARQEYASRAGALRAELAKVDEALADALARSDRIRAAQVRVAELAHQHRKDRRANR